MTKPDGIICENGHEVAADASAVNFCRICGALLLRECPEGHLSPVTAQYCRECGRPIETTVSGAAATFRQVPDTSAPTDTYAARTRIDKPSENYGTTQPVPAIPIDRLGSAPTGPRTGSPTADGRRRSGPWLIVAVVAVVAVVGLAGGLLYVLTSDHPASKQTGGSLSRTDQPVSSATPASTSTTTTSTTTVASEQRAAQALSTLLAQSVVDRSSINAASNDVAACGPSLSEDQQTFDNAATSRQNLISQLSTLQGASTLPAAMIQSLSSAWQASEQVDQDYANWAGDEALSCTPNDTANQYYQEALTPNQEATQAKMAFATAWDPIAISYNLPTYQWNQL